MANRSDHYPDASFLDEQMRMIDLVPRRLTILALWLAAGLAIISGLEVLYNWQCELSATIAGGQFAAFDLTQTGCLGSWFASLLLLAASVAAVLTYTIRRHRTDDYHGRYRIWLWAALCCFFAATDVAADLHESLRQIMIHLTNTRVWGDGSLWWIIPCVLVLGALGSRLVLDMRPCRLSITALSLAAAGYLVAACMELGLVSIGDAVRTAIIKAGCALYGHLMLLMSMALNARYVILDAEGLLPRRESKKHEDSDNNVAKKSSGTEFKQCTRVDSPSGVPQPMLRASSTAPTSSSVPQPIFSKLPPPPASVTRKLTKQEKKALRDRLIRERLERQRR
ncbi:MAG: hypothetical protein ABSE63_01080 [Thermoguttaceae bacterium]